MPNGDVINDKLEFQDRIKGMSLEDRSLHNAIGIYDLTIKLDSLGEKLDGLDVKFDDCITGNSSSKKVNAATSGIVATIIIGIVEGLKVLFNRG